MKTYTLAGGDAVPAVGLGTWKSAKGEVYKAVKEALSIGYRHIDCALIYDNEAEIGAAFAETDVPREDLWITSKLWNNAHAPENVLPNVQKTLDDLQLDYLDLYLIHWPVRFVSSVVYPSGASEFLPWEKEAAHATWAALEECVKKGLIRNLGVSNFSTKKLQTILDGANIAPVMNQIEMHPYLQQRINKEFCDKNNIMLTAYSPLGSSDRPAGLKKADEPSLLGHPVINQVAEKHGASAGQVLIAWAVQRDTVVIPKSVNPERLRQNLAAAELQLDSDDMAAINALDAGYRFVDGTFWCPEGSPYTLDNIWDGE